LVISYFGNSSLAKSLATFVWVSCLLFLSSGTLKGQSDYGSTPLGQKPGSPLGSYSLSDIDTVNLFNGHVSIKIPLLNVSGRGDAKSGAFFTSNSPAQWHVRQDVDSSGFPLYYAEPATSYSRDGISLGKVTVYGIQSGGGSVLCNGTPLLYYSTLTRLYFVEPDGTEHEMRDTATGGQPFFIAPCQLNGQSRGKTFVSVDGSGATFIADAPVTDFVYPGNSFPYINPAGDLLLKNGARYRINDYDGRLRDRNGNLLSWASEGQTRRITDSLNREVKSERVYGSQCTLLGGGASDYCEKISYKGFGGAQRTIWLTYDSSGMPLQLFLPNGLSYHFYYNDYGDLVRIDLPTGGSIEYTYGPGLAGSQPNYPEVQGAIPGIYAGGSCAGDCNHPFYVYRRLEERRVYRAGHVLESKQTFSKPETFLSRDQTENVGYVDKNQYDGNGNLLSRERHYFHGSAVASFYLGPTSYSPWRDGREYQTDIYNTDGSSTVLRRIIYTWNQTPPAWYQGPADDAPANNTYLAETTTTLVDTNQVSKQTFSYDQYNNQTDVYEYDYGTGAAGALLRRTHTDFANATNLINGVNYSENSIHLRSLPIRQEVFDGNGVRRALTTYEYDTYVEDTTHAPLVSRSSISGLDSAFTSSYMTRGNVTAMTRSLLNSTGAITGSISSYTQYDVAGNVVKTIDARAALQAVPYSTTFDYSDNFGTPNEEARTNNAPGGLDSESSYAFLTKVTNALGHIAYTQYDYYTGMVVNTEDANSVVFSMDSCSGAGNCDPLDRLKLSIRDVNNLAAKSSTIIDYDDANHVITTRSDMKTYGDGLLKSESIYDDLGRTMETRRYETATSYVATRQEYDALGRVSRTYNPFRTTGDETYGRTDTTYDALSRVKKVETFDGNGTSTGIVQTEYSGGQVLVTDQAGKKRMSITNALGQLKDVWEITPNDQAEYPGADGVLFGSQNLTGFLTSYEYDALNNLTKVTQGTQTSRVFAYNSLGQLTSATNPESGNITYVYDENGNLKQKTDARNIITTYIYDELNRVSSRTYQNDAGVTPAVYYKYDSQNLPAGAPSFLRGSSTGRLVAVLYGGTNSTTGNYYGYDALGHVELSIQRTNIGQSDQTYNFPNYDYDLAGNLTSQQYPSGKIILTEYDNAGRINGVTGQKTGEQDKTYASFFSYTAHGAVGSVKLGNALWEHTSFNGRLQPVEIGLGESSATSDKVKLSFYYGVRVNNALDATKNNGNLEGQTINGAGLTLTQSYSYDALNRLKTFSETEGSSQTAGLSQVYEYDRWSNRAVTVGYRQQQGLMSTPQSTDDFNPNNNRIKNAVYDNAGNLTSAVAGHLFYYDAENKMTAHDDTSTVGTLDSQYSYDGDGRRVKKVVGSVTTIYVYNALGQMVAEYTDDSNPSQTSGTSYFTSDHLGTPRVITNKDKVVISRHDYMPFGEEIKAGTGGRTTGQGYVDDSDGVRQKFTQKERDSETELDYFEARYYSSSQGRFTSPDEFKGGPNDLWSIRSGDSRTQALVYADATNPQSLNKYLYAYNNPLRYVDQDGHNPQEGVEYQLRADEKAFAAGKITAGEFLARCQARGVGGAVAAAIVATVVYGPEAAASVLIWAAQNPDKVGQMAQGFLELMGGPPGVTMSSPSRLRPAEIDTGFRLAKQLGTRLLESPHVGEEFIISGTTKTIDVMGTPAAYSNFGSGRQFFSSIMKHLNKSVDYVAVDLKGASQNQIKAIQAFVNSLKEEQRARIIYVK
jgi:RHS repeat-associated protein